MTQEHPERIEAIAAAPLAGDVSMVFVCAGHRWRFHRWRSAHAAALPSSFRAMPGPDDRARHFGTLEAAAAFFRQRYGALPGL
jgi:hypothetical protein